MLADVVRTDRHNHRESAGDSEGADAIKVLARANRSAIWSRQREKNALRNALKDYCPAALNAFGTELDNGDATAKSIQASLREEQLHERPRVEAAFGKITSAHVAMIRAYTVTITELEAALAEDFEQRPARSLAGTMPARHP